MKEMLTGMKCGVILKRLRIEKGMTQTELASRLNTSNSVISMIERDKQEITIAFLERYASILSTTVLAIIQECYTLDGKKFMLAEERSVYEVHSKVDMNILLLIKQNKMLYERMMKNPESVVTLMNYVVIATETYVKNRY